MPKTFRPKTLRRMPRETRELARLANELASVQTRLANRIGKVASLENDAALPDGLLPERADHRAVISAALLYVEAVHDGGRHVNDETAALERLEAALAPFTAPVFADLESDGTEGADHD